MRTLDSWHRQETKLRALHTQQTQAGKWLQAQTTRAKLVMVLNAIKELQERADALLPKAPRWAVKVSFKRQGQTVIRYLTVDGEYAPKPVPMSYEQAVAASTKPEAAPGEDMAVDFVHV